MIETFCKKDQIPHISKATTRNDGFMSHLNVAFIKPNLSLT